MLFIRNVTFMSTGPRRLADFWAAALELPERRDEPNETILADVHWKYPRLTFQLVDEQSPRPRQVHLDLTADDRRAEVARLRVLGAQEQRTVTVDDWAWTVMSDPDGNEFCVNDP